jgi:hypothetical protein
MIGNILGEAFDSYVDEQIKVRQKIYGKSSGRTPQELIYLNGRTAWARMISSIDLIEDKQFNTGKKRLQSLGVSEEYFGDGLAKNFILFAGTSKAETTSTTDENGAIITQVNNPSINNLRKGINGTNILSNAAYGLGGTEFGLQPMPHLGDISITNRGEYGAYREATINIKCYNPKQFEIINILYLSIGYTVLLEWGHNCYFNNNEEFISNNTTSLQQYFFDKKNANNHIGLFQIIKEKRQESNGNFDALFGMVTNYTWTFENGVYNIDLKLTSIGSIVESLVINTYGNITGSNAEPQSNSITTLMNEWKSANEVNWDTVKTKEIDGETQVTNLNEIESGIKTFSSTKSTLIEIAKLLNIESSSDFSGEEINNEIPSPLLLPSPFIPPSSKNQIDFFKFNSVGLGGSFAYIRFGALLEFIEKTELIYNFANETSPQSLLTIDYNSETNFMTTTSWMVVTDPFNCIFNSGKLTSISVTALDAPVSTQFSDLPEFKTSKYGEITLGKVMNVFLNCDMVSNTLKDSTDNKGNVNLLKFLQSICNKISESVGYLSELKPTIDEENNILKIVENGELPNKKKILENFGRSTKYSSFDVFGYNNFNKENQSSGFVKSFNIKTQITNDIYTTAALGAQAIAYPVKNIDPTNFSYMYRGLQDRIINYKQTPQDKNIQQEERENQLAKDQNDRYSKAISTYDEILGLGLNRNIASNGINDKTLKFSEDDVLNYKSAIKSLIEERKRYTSQIGGVSNIQYMPINFSMTLDGLSGMKIFQNFKADSRFLPYPYPDTITLNINPSIRHKISNNIWTTEVETKFVPEFVKTGFIETTEETTREGFYGTNKKGIGLGAGSGGGSEGGGNLRAAGEFKNKTYNPPSQITPNADRLRLALLRIRTPFTEVYEKDNPNSLLSNDPAYKNLTADTVIGRAKSVGLGGQLTNSGKDITPGLALFAENIFQTVANLYPNQYNIRISAGNDFAHAGSDSSHNTGNGLDFVIYPNKGNPEKKFKVTNPFTLKEVNLDGIKNFPQEPYERLDNVITIIQEFIAGENQKGIKMGYIDEYRYPSPSSSGGHIHIRYGGYDRWKMPVKNGYQLALERFNNGEIIARTLKEYSPPTNPFNNSNF